MEPKAMHKRYQSYNSEETEINRELFSVICKRNISTQEKLQEVKKLLEQNPQPDINAQDGNANQNTVLHLAIKRNDLELVKFLLTQGADTTIQNGNGKTPLNLAEERTHVEITDALKNCASQGALSSSGTERLVSHNSQPVAASLNTVSGINNKPHELEIGKQAASTVLPPFSEKLRVDEKLKLSHDDFKQSIKEYHENKQLAIIDQLKATPHYPTPHVLAQFASIAYRDYKLGEPKSPDGWKLLTTASHFGIKNGYFGTAYWHPENQQVVIAHRGTDIKNVGALVADLKGVLFNNYVKQMSSASTFANKVVSVLQEIEHENEVSFELFFTGHSLGGWLAQVTAFTTEYLEVEGGKFLQSLTRQGNGTPANSTVPVSHDNRQGWLAQFTDFITKGLKVRSSFNKNLKTEQDEPPTNSTVQDIHYVRKRYHPHTVVFDSPGCKDMLSQMADKLDVRLKGRLIDLEHLDITSYLSAPNRINTCNSHLGTVYRIFTDLTVMDWKVKHTPLYNLATHRMDKILEAFDPETGKDNENRPKIREVVDWPVSAGLTGGAELNDFFKWAEHLNNYHAEVMDTVHSKVPIGYHPLRYQTKAYDECTKSLRIFNQDQREFLESYCLLCDMKEFFKPGDLFFVMNNEEAAKEAEIKLQNFELLKENVRCQDPSKLRTLIPYVNRLVRFFPHIKDNMKAKLSSPKIRERVYQNETKRYAENIDKNALDFKPEALCLNEFLTSDQKVWQLRMVDGDAWTGITKVYRVLQNTSFSPNYSSEGHHTILKLKRLLTVNRIINLKELLASMETGHLLMIACGNNQPVNDELTDMFNELFSIMKEKKFLKIILTTQSESNTGFFLEQTGSKTLEEGFITTDEQLTWSDLTASSQTEILKKTVIFQGKSVALNELTSAETLTESFKLADLLQKKELKIGEEIVRSACSGYNEKYYIGRTFKQNIFIKQDISNGDKFVDLLASSEQEFKQLCQQNPNKNVHWLEKEISGEFIWQQTQGNLRALREYIVTNKYHSYAPSDLDKLLQQAKHHRLMLIADTAGMGKSTVLTHLSERIKEKFPAHWLVRIDLNDYTEQLKAQKGKKVDKETVVEFLSKEVLKLESHLEKELFKKNFEGNEVSKLVIMVDGFDEISPSYKETVIDMLQVLKQTSIEQLWVTTRPHLREELEDNLQQLSYTLQPYSEAEQVEFLKKFWLQNLNLENKKEHRLDIYAKALNRKLAQSISDKDREFTGIPLQTRMLAEAFEKDFRSFYLSDKSEPELPHKLDLLVLYRRFINTKLDIFFKEKSKFQPSNIRAERVLERESKMIEQEHQLLALEALFTEYQVKFLQSYDRTTFPIEELAMVGIAQRNSEGKLYFIHRTFAEYFVAGILINQLTRKTKHNEQLMYLLLNEVLLRKDCHVIRAFMDGLLENSKPSTEALKEYGDLLDKQWNKEEVQGTLIVETTALHEAAAENNARIIGFLLDSLKAGEYSKFLKVILLVKDDLGRTAWHVAAEEGHIKVVENLWIWAKAQLNNRELKNEVLFGKDGSKRTAWHSAALWGRINILVKLWEWAAEVQIKPEELRDELWVSKDLYGGTSWHNATKGDDVKILEKLWDWAKELQLKPEELKNKVLLSKDEHGLTAWHLAAKCGRVEILEKLWYWAKELQLKPGELRNEVLLSKGKDKETAWNLAAEGGSVELLEKMWEWAKELQLKPEEIKNEVFLSKHKYREAVWHLAAEGGRVEVLEKLWDWAKKLQLKPEELKNEVLLSESIYEKTAWQMAALKGRVEILEKLWEWAKELQLKPEKLRNEVFLSKDEFGNTAWHLAAKGGHVEILEKLWNCAKELQLKPEELKNELFSSKDEYQETARHMTANGGHVEVLEKLWDKANKLQLKSEELRNKVGLSKDKFREAAWHLAAKGGHVALLQKVWDWAKELQLKPEDLRNEVFLSKDKYGGTAWHLAAAGGNVELLEKLWDWAKELKLKPEELRNEVLLSKGKYGGTAWHLAAGGGSVEVLEKLWNWAKKLQLKPEELTNEVFLSRDKCEETAWHMAANCGCVEVLDKLWDWAKELQLKPEELRKKLCLSKEEFREAAWHLAAKGGHVALLEKVWDWAKKLQLKPEKLRKEVLLSKDKNEKTAWHMAANGGHVEVLEKLWDWDKELQLKPEELGNEVWLSKDEFRDSVWQLTARGGRYEVLEKLWDWAKRLQLKPEELRNEVLLSKNKYGGTAWHLAAGGGHVEILEKLWDWAKELQLKPEELRNELLLSKDKHGETAWHLAERGDHVEVLEKLWNLAEELQLKAEELRNEGLLSKDEYEKKFWHMAANGGNVKVLEKMWDWAKKLQLNAEELWNDVWLPNEKIRDTAWHLAAKGGHVELIEKVWDWARKLQLNPEELRNEVLFSKDEYEETAWQMAANGGHVKVLEKLWDWAKELQLKPEELRNEVWLSKDIFRESAWHLAARGGHLEILEKLWDRVKELQLKPEELRNEVFLSKDKNGETAWHLASRGGQIEVLVELWDWAKELQLKAEELRYEVLISKNNFGETAWDMAAEGGRVEVLYKLWDWAKELQLKPEELMNEVRLSKDKFRETAWHLAARGGQFEVLQKLWDWAKELQLKPEELRNEVFLSKDRNGETAWHLGATGDRFEVLEKLWDWAKELQLKPEELRNEVLLSKDKHGQTAWHLAAIGGRFEIIEKLWDLAKDLQLNPEELRNEFLLSKNKYGETTWHLAAIRGRFDVLEKLWDWAKELQLKPEELRNEVLLSKDKYEKTAWHRATNGGHVEVLEKLWDWAKELQLKPEELRNEVILSKDKHGQTAWHLAARFGRDEVLNKLWNWAEELQLKPEELYN